MSTRAIRDIFLTNSMSGKREKLETLVPGKLSFYSCGPTVYSYIHIGNLRGGLAADMFARYFKRVGYDVNYVRNYTDVDDRIIERARKENLTPDEFGLKYIKEVEKDYAVAGMREPTCKPRVTEHIPEIIALIQRIIDQKKAYVVDGEVFFSILDFPSYGKLAGKNVEDLSAGIRVEIRSQKKNPLDFSLWKPAKPGEPSWNSPWGPGRPGWHIECSAMSSKWLGDRIDVHHGGEDLVFPHHENEIAQSEAASGQAPFVRYWLHHAFLTLSKEKMSKSLGNVFNARDFLTQFGGEVARYMLLSPHYRSLIDFGEETIEQSLSGLQRIYEAKAKAQQILGLRSAVPDLKAETLWGSFVADCEAAKKEIDDAYAHDFNTPGALAALFKLIREFNRILVEPLATATPSAVLGAQALIQVMEDDIGDVLGVARAHPEKVLSDIARIRAQKPTQSGLDRPTESEVLAAIQARADARKAKNFAEGDRLRKDLEARGVILKDSPTGTTWEYS